MIREIEHILGDEAEALLTYESRTIPKEALHLPGPDFIDRVMGDTDRSATVLRNLSSMFNHGRLAGTGYLSILPVDQCIEHSAGDSIAPNIAYYDLENIIRLAIEGGCNAVATGLSALGAVARKYACKIPLLLNSNHNEFLAYSYTFDQMILAVAADQSFAPAPEIYVEQTGKLPVETVLGSGDRGPRNQNSRSKTTRYKNEHLRLREVTKDNEFRRKQKKIEFFFELIRDSLITLCFILIVLIILYHSAQKIMDPNASPHEKELAFGLWGVVIGTASTYLCSKVTKGRK
jgi:hypothetical protein